MKMDAYAYLLDVHERAREDPDEGRFFCVECGCPIDESDEDYCDDCWPNAEIQDDEDEEAEEDELSAHVTDRLDTLLRFVRRGR